MSLIGEALSGIKFALDILAEQDSRRKEVAVLILHIAETIEFIVREYVSGAGISPERFSEFSCYCYQFSEIAGSALSPETNLRIERLLKYALHADRAGYKGTERYRALKRDQSLTGENIIVSVFEKLTGPSISSKDLERTLEIAGELRAVANIMKISKRKI